MLNVILKQVTATKGQMWVLHDHDTNFYIELYNLLSVHNWGVIVTLLDAILMQSLSLKSLLTLGTRFISFICTVYSGIG